MFSYDKKKKKRLLIRRDILENGSPDLACNTDLAFGGRPTGAGGKPW